MNYEQVSAAFNRVWSDIRQYWQDHPEREVVVKDMAMGEFTSVGKVPTLDLSIETLATHPLAKEQMRPVITMSMSIDYIQHRDKNVVQDMIEAAEMDIYQAGAPIE